MRIDRLWFSFTLHPAVVMGLSIISHSLTVSGTPAVSSLVTCPGFPGYCSESYVGDTCTVVCARGRNNVPQCQSDGTWVISINSICFSYYLSRLMSRAVSSTSPGWRSS